MRKYFKHKIKSLLIIHKIVSIHFLQPSETIRQEEEQHDFWEVVYVHRGSALCTSNERQYELKEGYMLFHQPNESHTLVCEKGSEIAVVSFDCLSESMHFFTNKILRLSHKQRNVIMELVDIANKTYNTAFYNSDVELMELLPQPTLGGEQLIKNYLELLFIDMMRLLTEKENGNAVFLQDEEINNKLAEDIIKILKDNVYSRLSVDDIAKKINYSKAYIFRQFKTATGMSVMEYYLDLKIKAAKDLLLIDELSVKEISEKLSFDTPNYFSKTFKKITGMTSSEYKKRETI